MQEQKVKNKRRLFRHQDQTPSGFFMYATFVATKITLVQQLTSNATFSIIKGTPFLLALAVRNNNGQTEWANLD